MHVVIVSYHIEAVGLATMIILVRRGGCGTYQLTYEMQIFSCGEQHCYFLPATS
jgi:hypothetical protein